VVTFLFTDVEGSTRRWENDADAMRAALADLSMANDSRTYDSMSFNSGCYDAIRDNGDPVNNQAG
jgi:hypothetical protein